MLRVCVLNLIFPAAGVVLVWLLRSGEGFEPTSGFLVWCGAAALLQALAALLLLRPTPSAWKRGWTLLWLSCVAYMGAFSSVYLQRTSVEADRGGIEEISQCLYVTMNINPDGAKAEKECGDFLSAYYHKPFEEVRKQLLVIVGDGAQVEDQLRGYSEAGARVFVVRFAGGSQEEQLDHFVSELLPRFS